MIISFFSPAAGQAGTSANLLAIASLSALKSKKKHLMLQLGSSDNAMDRYFKKKEVLETSTLEAGIDILIRSIRSKKAGNKILYDCSSSIWKEQLDYLSGTQSRNEEIFQKELGESLEQILTLTRENYDFVFVDIGNLPSSFLEIVYPFSDLFIINLSQNPRLLFTYQELFHANLSEKNKALFYLIGKYDAKSILSEQNLRHSYSFLNKKNMGVLPYHTEYLDALSTSSVAPFFLRNEACTKDDRNYYFIKELENTIKKIMKYLQK